MDITKNIALTKANTRYPVTVRYTNLTTGDGVTGPGLEILLGTRWSFIGFADGEALTVDDEGLWVVDTNGCWWDLYKWEGEVNLVLAQEFVKEVNALLNS